MGGLGKIIAIALTAAVFCSVLKYQNKSLSVILSLAGCLIILMLGLHFLEPIIELASKLRSLSGIDQSIVSPLLKVVGISVAAELAEGICADSGENAIGRVVRQTAVVLALYASLPLLSAVLELMEKMMGGSV